jgi:hypothetical protein
MATWVCPPLSEVMLGLDPLNGTWRKRAPVFPVSSSMRRWGVPPVPLVPTLKVPGFFFAYSSRSFRVWNGESDLTTTPVVNPLKPMMKLKSLGGFKARPSMCGKRNAARDSCPNV